MEESKITQINHSKLQSKGLAKNLRSTGRNIRVVKRVRHFPYEVFCTKPKERPTHFKNPITLVLPSRIIESVSSMKRLRTNCIKLNHDSSHLPSIVPKVDSALHCKSKQTINSAKIFNLRQIDRSISRQRYYQILKTERVSNSKSPIRMNVKVLPVLPIKKKSSQPLTSSTKYLMDLATPLDIIKPKPRDSKEQEVKENKRQLVQYQKIEEDELNVTFGE